MEDSKRYIRLGLLVVVSLSGLVAGLSVLGWRLWFQPAFMFETYFDQSISGLELGAPVSFRGVPLGQVVEILTSAAPYESNVPIEKRHDYIVVRVKASLSAAAAAQMNKDIGTLIRRGLRAQTQLAGITGQQYLELDFLDVKKNPPLPFSWTPQTTYLPSAPSVAGEIIDKVQAFLVSLDDVDIPKLSRSLTAFIEHADAKLEQLPVAALSARTDDVLRRAAATLTRVERVVADPSLEQTLDNAEAISARLRRLADSGGVDRMIDSIDSAAERLDALIGDNQYDVSVLVQDLRATAHNLRALSEVLKRDPAGVLLGGPPPKIELPERTR
ncbi:MlaD family protein [Povalibacter sp.]|uniref:MlaD family protein n=1 Tax=Povalibacter sp. TaxID=1962978 RepID=UPI002F3FC008